MPAILITIGSKGLVGCWAQNECVAARIQLCVVKWEFYNHFMDGSGDGRKVFRFPSSNHHL